MKKFVFGFVLIVLVSGLTSWAQEQDKVLLTIDGKPVYLSEFSRILNKNSQNQTQADIKESLDLFVNFKLKVREAESMGLDTTAQFVTELKRNRAEIARPYLLDQTVNDELLEEAYQRSLEEIRSSHILVAVTMDSPAADTLRAYQKAMKIVNRLKAGEDFATVAKEVSEDPSAQTNGGDLGYFTVFQAVYLFENAIYNTPIGEISKPVRTQFGYHIIKITDKRPARGQFQLAVIQKAYNFAMTDDERLDVKKEIDRIDELIQQGDEFSELAKKYSDDRTTGNRGGITRWVGVGAFPTELEDAAFALENIGDITSPIETKMGWYIIQLMGKKENPPKEEVISQMTRTIGRQARFAKSRKEIAKKLKAEYNFDLNKKNYEEFYRLVDPSIFAARWDPIIALQKTGVLFTLGNMKVLQKEFAEFLTLNMKQISATTIAEFVDREFDKFAESRIMQYEDSKLDEKYPDFRNLYQEFHDGNLLFEITDLMVWSKASKDTIGLLDFHENHKNNYLWGERADGYIVHCKSKTNFDGFSNAIYNQIDKNVKKGLSLSELEDLIATVIDPDAGDSFEITAGPFAKGTNRLIDEMKWKKGSLSKSVEAESVLITWIQSIRKPEPKALSEARGQITADYQDFLESQWVESLKQKYSVIINKDVIETIK
ncbi:MAG: peptidylprolyl isomerase [Bacteroidales bacterium]|nr:peptidylprolyl isomerase [Bacteroidales bacterium]